MGFGDFIQGKIHWIWAAAGAIFLKSLGSYTRGNALDLARRRRENFGFWDLILGEIHWIWPAAGAKISVRFFRNCRHLSTNYEISQNHNTKFVDSTKFVERWSGELHNCRQMSTIYENVKKQITKFVDSPKFVDCYFEKSKSDILENCRLCLRGGQLTCNSMVYKIRKNENSEFIDPLLATIL